MDDGGVLCSFGKSVRFQSATFFWIGCSTTINHHHHHHLGAVERPRVSKAAVVEFRDRITRADMGRVAARISRGYFLSKKPRFRIMIDATTMATTAEILALARFSASYLARLERDGIVTRKDRNLWPLRTTINAIVTHLRRESRRGPRGEADVRLVNARAQALELRTKREANELVPADEFMTIIDSAFGLFVSHLGSVAARCTRDTELRRKIDWEINAARQAIADECDRQAEAVKASGKAAM